ncbi:PREDICTED: calmodulin-binding protein 25 [Brassica oleracea var. oleracea]|uniref:VQ domain-containing protein n=1 Tax=Brassica oleracea var. oleracea TaxID=109376 RepID=A0A0D3C5K0_BRAOL|nr:PREDICTED: calmodulin-binding protein 25 [Brassica oleracea var. oleracea]
MVTSEGVASVEPWLYRQGFNVDSWLLPDTFSHDNDLLAKALHNTVSAPPPPPHTLPPSLFFDSYNPSSNVSGGSSQEVVAGGAKRKHNCILAEGKATKRRRSRPSKKPQTTFITADPSNFRQMVQQVTGAKCINNDASSSVLFTPIVKPEPHRLVNILSGAVPTLDTSAFLTNHHQESLVVGNIFSGSENTVGLPSVKANATVNESGSAAEFDPYPTFPTLESWKVM